MPERGSPRFGTVSLDVDSTLCGIEGIDWLAARRGADVAANIAALTEAAMAGAVSIGDVYARRLEIVAPTHADVDALGCAYVAAIAPGAAECIASLRSAGVRVVVLSGGVRQAVLRVAEVLGVSANDVFAVELTFAADGAYADFDRTSPLATDSGKARIIGELQAPPPILHVGDGMTDALARTAADAFAAYTGFVARDAVVRRADVQIASFSELTEFVR